MLIFQPEAPNSLPLEPPADTNHVAPEAEADPFQTKSKVAQSPTKPSFDPETIDDPFKSKTKIANSPTAAEQVSLTANVILNCNTFLIRTFSYAAGYIS